MAYPQHVTITEVGPRDGLQSVHAVLPTAEKRELILELLRCGLGSVQITSFVHPAAVPQLADAEDLVNALPPAEASTYTALTLNRKGVERAGRCGMQAIEVSLSASERQSRSNTGLSTEQALEETVRMVALARELGVAHVRGSIQCAFGFASPGDVPRKDVAGLAAALSDLGVDCLVLADTTGLADPNGVRRLLEDVRAACSAVPLGLHLHDTFGLGLVNLMAGLELGVTRFDASLGGLGGCPFLPGAAGNIATEDAVYLLQRLGVDTGVDVHALAAVTSRLEERLGRALPRRVTEALLHRHGGCRGAA